MKKSEKLARELVALTESYSEKDFAEAIALLKSGKLFRPATSGAMAAVGLKRRTSPVSPSAPLKPENEVDGGEESLLDRFPEGEQLAIKSLIRRLETGELFPSNVHLRGFAEEIGVHLPQKTPPRRDLVLRILYRFLMLNEIERLQIIEEASKRSTGESSLKRWSNLIVKSDDPK